MDNFMKKTVMSGPDFITDAITSDIYYRIPDVANYYLRHDGKIIYLREDTTPEVVHHLSDCMFDSFNEAESFMKFFGVEPDFKNPCIFYIGGLDETSHTFNQLIEYARTDDVSFITNVLIVADETRINETIYRPMVIKDCNFNYNDDNHKLDIQSVMAVVMKPIPELPDCYRITGGRVQKLIQIKMEANTEVSGNTILRFAVAPMDIDHANSIRDFRFHSVEQIVFALKLFNANSVLNYTENAMVKDTKYTQQYIRYFDKNDEEVTLYIRTVKAKSGSDEDIFYATEIV